MKALKLAREIIVIFGRICLERKTMQRLIFRKKAGFVKSNLGKATIIVTSVFLFCVLFNCFFYEVNDEPTFELMMRGGYWGTPVSVFQNFFIGISHIYVFLYSINSLNINFLGISFIFFNWVIYLIFTFLILNKNKQHGLFLAVIYILISFSSIYLISFTRIAISGALAALLLLLWGLEKAKKKNSKGFVLFSGSIIFLFSFLLRPDGAILGLLIFFPFAIWKMFAEKKFRKQWVFWFAVPVFFGLISKGTIHKFDQPQENAFSNESVQNIVSIVDYKRNFKPEHPDQERVLYQVINWFFADKDVLVPGNYKKMKRYPDVTISGIKGRVNGTIEMFFLRPITLVILFLGITFLLMEEKKKEKSLLFLVITYFMGIVFLINFFLKLPNRIFEPILFSFAFFLIINSDYLSTCTISINQKKILIGFFIGFLLPGYFFEIRNLSQNNWGSLKSLDAYLISEKKPITFLASTPGRNYFPMKNVNPAGNTVQIPFFGWPSYYNQNYLALKKFTGTNDIKEIFEWISENNEKANIYSDNEQNKILENIFIRNNFKGRIIPELILDSKSGKGFYSIKQEPFIQ